MIIMDVKEILSEIKPYIDKEIEKFIPRKGDPQVLFDGFWYYLDAGGKRFRPALIALSAEALGGRLEQTLPAGAALELAHTFLLIHDDIEDFSDLRRGKPAMHIKYGLPHAVNIGDYVFMKTYEVLAKGKNLWGSEKTMRIIDIITEMFLRTGEGQAQEIEQRDKPLKEATFEWYEKMSLLKTGYYTGGIPCAIGGIIANGTERQIDVLKNFGFAVGVAFQIQDDILNLTETEEGESQLKKSFAEDLAEGKRTLILVHAYQNADKKDKEVLESLIGKKSIKMNEKKKIIDIFKKYNSINFAKEYARNKLRKALEEFKKVIPENEGRRKLEALADFLVEREF
jgi:geranylgeranyl diphosphate synthase type I